MSGRAPKLYLVAYDICDPKRWRKVYALIRGRGERLQYSVFRCVLSELALATLEDALLEVIDLEEDQVILIPLGVAEKPRSWRMTTLGKATPPPERTVTVV